MHVNRSLKDVAFGATFGFAFLVLCGCGGAATSYSPTSSNPAASRSVEKIAVDRWKAGLIDRGLTAAGCFEARYPATDWTRVACSTPTGSIGLPPMNVLRPATIGGTSKTMKLIEPANELISKAIGSFPDAKVSGVKTNSGDHQGRNSYGLQMNEVPFPTSACEHIAPNCQAWEQFVFSNYGPDSKTSTCDKNDPTVGCLGIQTWYINTSYAPITCAKGWTSSGDGYACYVNHHAQNVPNVPVSELQSMEFVGLASPKGDGIVLVVGKTAYKVQDVQSDGITDLSKHWQDVEFDIFGDADSSEAVFDKDTTITVNVQADTGVRTKPWSCQQSKSTTGESNNLSFVTAPSTLPQSQYPGMVYTESNAGGSSNKPLCRLLAGNSSSTPR